MAEKSLLRRIGSALNTRPTVTASGIGVDESNIGLEEVNQPGVRLKPVESQVQGAPAWLSGIGDFLTALGPGGPELATRQQQLRQQNLRTLAEQAIAPQRAAAEAKMMQQQMRQKDIELALKRAPKPIETPYGVGVYHPEDNTWTDLVKFSDLESGNLQSVADSLFGPKGELEWASAEERGAFSARLKMLSGLPPEARGKAISSAIGDMIDQHTAQVRSDELWRRTQFLEEGRDRRQATQLNAMMSRLGANQEGKILTVTEAATLGVPYGTTREEAFGKTPATEAMKTTANYASRLKQSGDLIDEVEPEIASMSLIGQGYQKLAPTWAKSKAGQKFDQAKRNFINAVLRRESGAVISEEEFKNGDIQYFPQPGDSTEVLINKKANRDLVVRNFISASGNAYEDPGTLRNPNLPDSVKKLTPQKEKILDFNDLKSKQH